MSCDVLIIGAGMAGLSAARSLSRMGRTVVVMEARNRIGGRVHTITENGFSKPVEAGAEFVHGKPRLTTALAKSAKIFLHEGEGCPFRISNGREERSKMFPPSLDVVTVALKKLKKDIPFQQFIDQYFPESRFLQLHQDAHRLIEGFDAADTRKISAFAVREEWSEVNEMPGLRPSGGYSRLANHLMEEAKHRGAEFLLDTVVTAIDWQYQKAVVRTTGGLEMEADKVLITIPPSVLKTGAIQFSPDIPAVEHAIQKIETGTVTKFLIEFMDAFWERPGLGFRHLKNLSFLFSDAEIPTWWTQCPSDQPLLTGWLPGTTTLSEDELLNTAFDSLAYLFDCSREALMEKIRMTRVVNWQNDPFACGAYSYKTPQTDEAIEAMTMPIAHTLYFAGEALNNKGEEMGTVEAALASAKTAVNRIREAL